MTYILALLIGLVAGLRSMIPLAAISWAAQAGWLDLGGTWLAFLGYAWTPWILSAMALGELVADQLPSTPSRTVPIQFGTRLLVGAAAGALIALGTDSRWLVPMLAGVAGALVGTLGGRAVRARLAAGFGRDWPAALIEDAAAIALAMAIVLALP
jgi:uncharacterized membrane protein